MEFFENAVNAAKDVLEVACKKTEDAVNNGKQRINVVALENKLSKDYEKLGILYYAVIKDNNDLDDETLLLKNAIEEKIEKIKTLKSQINDMKNKMVCPECGASVSKESAYCNICGAKFSEKE